MTQGLETTREFKIEEAESSSSLAQAIANYFFFKNLSLDISKNILESIKYQIIDTNTGNNSSSEQTLTTEEIEEIFPILNKTFKNIQGLQQKKYPTPRTEFATHFPFFH